MSKKIKNKILLEEFDDNEPINFSIFKEDNNKDNRYDKQNEDIIYNINNDITKMKNIEIIDDIENFNDELNDYNLDNIYLDNNINYLDMIDANSDINIEVFMDIKPDAKGLIFFFIGCFLSLSLSRISFKI